MSKGSGGPRGGDGSHYRGAIRNWDKCKACGARVKATGGRLQAHIQKHMNGTIQGGAK